MGLPPGQLRQGRLTYLLRRLRLHGLIERLPRSHRYRVTPLGLRTSVLAVRAHARLLRPGLAELGPSPHAIGDAPLRRAFERLERTIDARFAQAGLVA